MSIDLNNQCIQKESQAADKALKNYDEEAMNIFQAMKDRNTQLQERLEKARQKNNDLQKEAKMKAEKGQGAIEALQKNIDALKNQSNAVTEQNYQLRANKIKLQQAITVEKNRTSRYYCVIQ
jgi:predicted  nucleic acid-binding Zn-ribbon protein